VVASSTLDQCVGTCYVWKATSDIDRNAKTVKSDKSLFTTETHPDVLRILRDYSSGTRVSEDSFLLGRVSHTSNTRTQLNGDTKQ
jgi:hypothetical protein